MREIAVGAIALLIGLVIGGLGPRAELNRMMQTVETVDAERCKNTFGSDLATFFGSARDGGMPMALAPPPTRAEELAAANPDAAVLLEEVDAEAAAAQEEVGDELRAALASSEELELARSALELRRAQSRQAFLEQAEPDDVQMGEIDAAYDEMNESLQGLAGELAELVLNGGEPDRRQSMEFAADALDAMLVAEDRVLRVLDPEQREDVDVEAVNPFNYVSPSLIDALMDLDAAQ